MLIKTYITDLYSDDLSGPVDEVIKKLENLKEERLKLGWSNLSIEVETYYEGYEIKLYGQREEFPWETENRLKVEASNEKRRLADKERREKAKQKKLENEKALYEQLKAKYEN